ncbi:MAG: hypothetical protein C3L25_04370 [Candidatus Sedimenticola endophacoides]|nr:MAG: hypothetical protein C3L25_04370 [Candidatus Sedimenticola endophacoides]
MRGRLDFWCRMAILHPDSIKMNFSHTTTPERVVALEQTVAEIKAKQANGPAFAPEYRDEEEL